jgi:hypothetical protein
MAALTEQRSKESPIVGTILDDKHRRHFPPTWSRILSEYQYEINE